MLYILKQGVPVLCNDLDEWSRWMTFHCDEHHRTDDLPEGRVTTVFLGMDRGFRGGPPLLWEAMVFGGELDGDQQRNSTLAEAMAAHDHMVELVKSTAELLRRNAAAVQPEPDEKFISRARRKIRLK